ncbi:MAG: LiaI-LiaF-like domain-containing protein [Anaerolineae bacterium]
MAKSQTTPEGNGDETRPPPAATTPAFESLFAAGRGGRRSRPRRRSFFWPLLLIGLGVIFLLSNLGYLPGNIWTVLWRFWPLLLVFAGLDILLAGRSVFGAILAFLLVLVLVAGAAGIGFFAQSLPGLVGGVELKRETVSHPQDGLKRAEVIIDWTAGPATLAALEDSRNLIEADVGYYGDLVFDVTTRGDRARVELGSRQAGFFVGPGSFPAGDAGWNVYLSPDVLLDLDLDMGSGRASLDLRGLQVADLRIDVGSGPVELILPQQGAVQASVDGGSGALEILLPEGMEARLMLDGGSGVFRPGPRFRRVEGDGGERRGDGIWETADLGGADNFVELAIDQGSGNIVVR